MFLKEKIKNIVRGVIKENNSPDHIFLQGKEREEKLSYTDDDAICFFLTENNIFYCDYSITHFNMKYNYIAKQLGFENIEEYKKFIQNNNNIESEFLEEEFEAMESELRFHTGDCVDGRYWVRENIIAFWYEVPQYSDFVKIINGLSQFIQTKININNIIINIDDNFILANEYFHNGKQININKEKSEELRALHLMNAEEKTQTSQMQNYLQNKSANIGKKLKYKDMKGEMPMAQWRALHNTSENKQHHFIDILHD